MGGTEEERELVEPEARSSTAEKKLPGLCDRKVCKNRMYCTKLGAQPPLRRPRKEDHECKEDPVKSPYKNKQTKQNKTKNQKPRTLICSVKLFWMLPHEWSHHLESSLQGDLI